MKFRYDKEKEELVVSESTRIEYHQMKLWLTRHVKGYKFTPQFKMGVWNGQQSYFRDGKINLGLWKELLKACKEIEVPFIMENKEDFPLNRDVSLEDIKEFCFDFFKNHKIKKGDEWIPFMPYEHQIETAYKIIKNRYCMAEVATSGGKSLIISIVLFYTMKYIDPNAKFLIIVPSISLVTQFYDDLLQNFYGENILEENKNNNIDGSKGVLRIEEVMSEKPRKWSGKLDANVYIGTYQSLEKWPKDFFKQFHTVITDEAHSAKNRTITTILGHTFGSAYSRFGVSGTFPIDTSCEILSVQSVLGPKITEVTAKELINKGIITQMDIKSIILNHNNPELDARMYQIRKAGYGKEALEIEKEFIHQSDKRIEFIKKIISKCEDNTLLLFHTIEYGEKLFTVLSEAFPDKNFHYIDGSISGKKREEIKKKMEQSAGIQILVASFGTLAVGVSVRNLHNVIFADSFKSEQIIIQAIGRALRLHSTKKVATIYDLVDVFKNENYNNILYTHYKERLTFYKKREYPYREFKINL